VECVSFATCVELQLLNEDDFCDKSVRTISINKERNVQLNAASAW